MHVLHRKLTSFSVFCRRIFPLIPGIHLIRFESTLPQNPNNRNFKRPHPAGWSIECQNSRALIYLAADMTLWQARTAQSIHHSSREGRQRSPSSTSTSSSSTTRRNFNNDIPNENICIELHWKVWLMLTPMGMMVVTPAE